MRRRKLLAVIAGLAVLALGAFVMWPRPDRITRENYDFINEGMTLAEVEAILGPPGDHTTGDTEANPFGDWRSWRSPTTIVEFDGFSCGCWIADTVAIYVNFDDTGHVMTKYHYQNHKIEHGSIANFLWRAKRHWRQWFPENPDVLLLDPDRPPRIDPE
jgi:hypothetical protein